MKGWMTKLYNVFNNQYMMYCDHISGVRIKLDIVDVYLVRKFMSKVCMITREIVEVFSQIES